MSSVLDSIADAYTALQHAPDAPLVARAYASLQSELWSQFTALPLSVAFVDVDPYPSSAVMFASCAVGMLSVWRASSMPFDHPMMRIAPNGETYNSIFRAVHDGLAHFPGRHSFSVAGEWRAFIAHAFMLRSVLSVYAIATETIGQTAHYARYRSFAQQKAALLPKSLIIAALGATDNEISAR